MKYLTHLNCPSCHSPVARERYEHACGADSDYLVCPECDYTFLCGDTSGVSAFLADQSSRNAYPNVAHGMSIETESRHITPAGGNVFADLGFDEEVAATLQTESRRIVFEKVALADALTVGADSGRDASVRDDQ